MKNKPPYAIDSVDHALHLATMLQEGPLGVSEAAARLGVSRSTAHRLLAMLVYRDFAEQGPDRRYRAGPVLRPADPVGAPVALLREVAMPHLRALVARVRETVNLQVLAGTEARFLASVECDQILRVGDRAGRVLPAHLASGGKALLAALPAAELTRRYAGTDVNLTRLRRELGLIRRRGFAINDQLTETGLTAVGVAIPWPGADEPAAAVSVALPSARFDHDVLPTWVGALSATATAIARDLGDG
ncbi:MULTISPECIES: IclR family transcriptional regulator [Amycolatopsis]|uniref:Helix-turn-helix domain-containing protein n=1 Tax=Amycolatopsis thermalba TaxID=944492 RepID=A0ABY4P061_9PSEU|nr:MULTISPECIES: IclR family transcriptional regulator C-terminal domain-containing protein [Amycolatopsis]OXM65131.1 transcriptional regulator [Amycolatopsis sp. KNN50.9b]UQS25671.1 helix-turn-helix domain-containing protein [Amycolatopsis thermalba]